MLLHQDRFTTDPIKAGVLDQEASPKDFSKDPFAHTRFLFELFDAAKEIGRPVNGAFYIRRIGETFIGPMDINTQEKLNVAKEWVSWATNYEKLNGLESLLDRNHPVHLRALLTLRRA